jgi:hypothetical protein
VKLRLGQLDDNYAQYIDKLRSSLLLCPDDHDEQVYTTFLSKMKSHPSPTVSLPFVTEHTNFILQGTLSGTFLELVAKAECLVLLIDLDTTKVTLAPTLPLPSTNARISA